MDIQIRQATAADIDIFVELTVELCKFNRSHHSAECKNDDFEAVLTALRAKSRATFTNLTGRNYLLIAEIDQIPAGYALAKIFEEDPSSDNGTGTSGLLDELYLNDHARGLGIGKKLIDEVTRWMQAKGVRRIKLHAYSWNDHAKNIYEKYGFKEFGVSYEKYL